MNRVNDKLIKFCTNNNPFTNVIGLVRSILALSTLLLFIFNHSRWIFTPAQGLNPKENIFYNFTIFGIFEGNLEIARILVIVIMSLVISGWRPRITGVLHYWVAFSIFNAATLLDGGEQVQVVITLLLLPITLLDNRKWHWQQPIFDESNSYLYRSMLAHIFIVATRIQIAYIYLQAAIERLKNPEWIDGTAIYYFMQVPMLGLNEVMKIILNPILTSPLVFFITWSITIVELMLAFGIVSSKKYWSLYLVIGVTLHVMIAILLGLWTFSLAMIACLFISYVPEEKHINFNKFGLINIFNEVKQKERQI